MKELILVKKAKNRVPKFDQKCIILKGIKKFSHEFQNFIFLSYHWLLLKGNLKLYIKLNTIKWI